MLARHTAAVTETVRYIANRNDVFVVSFSIVGVWVFFTQSIMTTKRKGVC